MIEASLLKDRLGRFQGRKWAAEVDAFLVLSLINIRYLTGFSGSSAVAFITKEESYFCTDFRYRTQSAAEVKNSEIIEYKNQQDFLAKFIQERGIKSIGIEAHASSIYVIERLRQSVPQLKVIDYEGEVEALRLRKDRPELEAIKKAIGIAGAGLEAAMKSLRPGAVEYELAAELEYEMKKRGSEKPPFDTIVASGPRAAMPHGIASDKAISQGEPVVIDFGARYNGYNCDITRTVPAGGWSDEGEKIYRIVLEAQRKAIDIVAPGASTKQIDAAARGHIAAKGYGEYFGHGTGHGVGLEVHEAPRLNTEEDHLVQTGMVFTIEPGIYIPNWGGVRIEDMVFVTEEGCEVITEGVAKTIF